MRNGGGIAYRSALLPHLDFIKKQRLQMKTWNLIAKELNEKGVSITARGIALFLQRHSKRPRPVGFPVSTSNICTEEKSVRKDPSSLDLPEPKTGTLMPAPQPKPLAFIPGNDIQR